MWAKRWVLLVACQAAVFAAGPVSLTIPSSSGPLSIDGKLNDAGWQGARVLPLSSSEFSAPFPAGGEARVATCGPYLCLAARIPEPDRVVAHSVGRNPAWWSEDEVTWNIRTQDTAMRRHLNLSLTVNPIGGYRIQGAEKVRVAAHIGIGEWTVEAAIPLEQIGQLGFIDVQRVRAARPDAPELRWYWPAANERATFQLGEVSSAGAPELSEVASPVPPKPETHIAPELAWIPKHAWSDEERSQRHISRMFEDSLRSRMASAAEDEKREWRKVDSREAWERFRDQRIAALRKSLGPMPDRTPLHTVVTRRANYGDDFVIENLVFESRPHLLVTANLYLPENPGPKTPAIVVVHSHHAPKTQSELQDLGMTWARSGTAVLVMDQLCAGERSQSQPWPREGYYGRYALGNQLLLTGESLMKWMVWDLMRSVDLLLERPYIDPQRIIMLGAVAGGGDPAAVTAVLDPRIAAVIPFNFGEAGPEEHYTDGPRRYDFETAWPGWGEWETTRSLPRSSVDQFFPWLLCAAVAPRPFLYSFEIGWPKDVDAEPVWARYQKVFEFYGARDHLDQVHGFGPFPGPGECNNVSTLLRQRIYPILKRWLNVSTPVAEYHNLRPDSDLMCLTPAVAAERKPMPASAVALEMARHRPVVSSTHLRESLQAKLGDIEPIESPAAKVLWTKSESQLTIEALSIETDRGITLPVYLLKPVGSPSKPMPVVLAISQGGKAQFLSEGSEDVKSLLRSGVAVCLPDLRNTGEVAATQSRGPGAMGLSESELMLGGTMVGAWLKDVRTVFRYLLSRPDIEHTHIALWGNSFAEMNADDFRFDQSDMQEPGPFAQHQAEPMGALLALLTGLYEDRVAAIAARGGLVSFISVLEDRFCHIPQDVIVPGILEVADVPNIVAAQGARPVRMERFVDGRNRIRGSSGEPALASWLVSQSLHR